MTAAQPCVSCDSDTRTDTEGLCGSCRDDLRFVVRPAAHRETYRRRVAAQTGFRDEMQRLGVVIVESVPDDNSLWICDLCNSRIPVDGEYSLIPLLGSCALCTPCVTTLPYWPDGWIQPTPRACRCGACQAPLLRALTPEPRHPHRPPSGRSIDR